MSNFTWIPFYKELAQKLLDYKDKQSELIDFLEELRDQKGLIIIPTKDKDATGQDIRLNEIDLFTFFATFNRGIKDEMRFKLLAEMKIKFNLAHDLPTDFNGIPVLNSQRSWLFTYKKDRQPTDISLLWKIAENVINNPNNIDPNLFNSCLKIKGVGVTYLTIGLYWLNPERFAACDKIITGYLKNMGFSYSEVKSYSDYLVYIQNIKNFRPDKSFNELSYDAWVTPKQPAQSIPKLNSESTPRYWLFHPGINAVKWDEFYAKGIMGLVWDDLDDLNQYPDKPSIAKKLIELGGKTDQTMNSAANYDFKNSISKDDVIIVKSKKNSLLGYGIVVSDYYFDNERNKFKSCRKVDWKLKGEWTTEFQLVQKTLTDITKYPTDHPDYKFYYERLMAIMKGPYTPVQPPVKEMKYSLNQILFGPPGTGKTYNSVNQALSIIDGEIPDDRIFATKRFRELIKKGQIVFTTFHQSMCYEDFIEGIKPVEPENEGDSISYKVIDGIFKQLAINAEFEYYKGAELNDKKEHKIVLFDDYWNRLIADIEGNVLNEVKTLSGKILIIQTVTGQGNVVVKPKQKDALEYIVSYNRTKKLFDAFSDLSKVKNIDKEFRQAIGGSNSTAYWGILNHLKNYNFLNEYVPFDPVEKEYSYDQKKDLLLNWNGFIDSKIKIKPYILIIDEINRGNVAQIFGELITLLEEDKRLGRAEELSVTLPYSKQKGFGVPYNLYIIGTMNTADRSVEALDTALRRRFTFIEMPPKYDLPELENEIIDGISLEMIMKTLNIRVEKLLDKDHLLGHSYFLCVDDIADLKRVFQQNIIPLLQEYFYGDFAKIGLVLGEAFFEKYEIPKKTIFAKFTHDAVDELNEKPVYRLKQSWTEGEFENAIMEMVNPLP